MDQGRMKSIIVLFLTASTLTLSFLSAVSSLPFAPPDASRGILDAHIAGTVVNGTLGMKIECKAMYHGAGTNEWKYFNGTTDAVGAFNITVNSNSSSYPLDPYMVTAFPTYYKGLNKMVHGFSVPISGGQTLHVPPGSLEAFDQKLGNLTVRILNGSSGAPLQNVVVTVAHVDPGPLPPFEVAKATNAAGEARWNDIRDLNTTVEARKLNFQDLSTTEESNYVQIGAGGNTMATFNLKENPWPFTLSPGDKAVDSNVSVPVRIGFGRVMSNPSISDPSNYRLVERSTADEVEIVPVPGMDDTYVDITVPAFLKYNTTYDLRLDTTLETEGGGHPLWRAMDASFTTELRPGTVSGRMVDDKDGSAAVGVIVKLSDQQRKTDEDGSFFFSIVPKGTYNLEALEGYLFNYTMVKGIRVNKGDDMDLGDIPTGAKAWGALEVRVVSAEWPVQGAFVKVVSSQLKEDEFNITTDEQGSAVFDRVKAGSVSLVVWAPHHIRKNDMTLVRAYEQNNYTVYLEEVPQPVTVGLTLPLDEGIADPETDLIIRVPEEIKYQTLSVDFWMLDDEGERMEEMTVTAPQKIEDNLTYLVTVPGRLPLERHFEVAVDSSLQALRDLSPLLWKDVIYRFRTPDLPMSYIGGTLLLEGRPFPGIEVRFDSFHSETDPTGRFNISLDLSEPTISGSLTADLSYIGYMNVSMDYTLNAGDGIETGAISSLPLEDWYEIDPADGEEGVDPRTNVTFTFMNDLAPPEDGWSKHLKVTTYDGNAPVIGTFTVMSGNRIVVFDPNEALVEGVRYKVEVGNSLLMISGVPVKPVGNITVFTVRPRTVEVSLVEPDRSSLLTFPLDGILRLSFSVPVNRSLLEGGIRMEPPPPGFVLTWLSSSEVRVHALYAPMASYVLTLASGKYGQSGEVLMFEFTLAIGTSSEYSRSHEPSAIQWLPPSEKGWKPGALIKLSGLSEGSEGYEVKVVLERDGAKVEYKTIVSPLGTWNLSFNAPDEEGTYTLGIMIGIPGAPPAFTKSSEVTIDKAENGGGGDGGSLVLIILAVVILVVIAGVVAALLFTRAQKRRLAEEAKIEYDEVDSDWSEE